MFELEDGVGVPLLQAKRTKENTVAKSNTLLCMVMSFD
jgi:hypothetical protein